MTTSAAGGASPSSPPAPGLLYWVDTVLLNGTDKKGARPAVVLALPAFGLTDVRLLMRTSKLDVRGIPHPAHPEIGLNKAGVFGFDYLRSLDIKVFKVPALVQYLGRLDQGTWEQVKQWWEQA